MLALGADPVAVEQRLGSGRLAALLGIKVCGVGVAFDLMSFARWLDGKVPRSP